MSDIKLSIITATWNSSKTVAATMESLARQTFQNYESIIVDGLSSDDTLDVVRRSGVRIGKIISERDKGIYDALNKGIAAAQGEYVGFLHSDDILASPSSLEKLVDCIDRKKPDAVYADLQYVDKENTNKVIRYWKSGSYSRSRLKNGWMPPHPTFYMRRNLYSELGGFNLNYKISADYDSLMRYLWVNNVRLEYLPEVLIKMRIGGASNRSLSNIIRKSKEDFAVMKEYSMPVFRAILGKNLSKLPQFFIR
ncbi:glycosyltransferase family 2 protein [Saccharophagus sp. K07]|uniref:glycosyltransferase family 2 protein n=1 Tax=Saccharophagus sp. K07 TaxID=2283636 RepID=UPI001CA32FA4|nr:glycosyltransferase family 2 protein [Saccharophagus sp. K07]